MSAVLNRAPTPTPVPPPPVKGSEFTDADTLATDPVKAKAYVARRRVDALALTAGGILVLPYAKITQSIQGGFWVNGVLCSNADCTLAYILARWW